MIFSKEAPANESMSSSNPLHSQDHIKNHTEIQTEGNPKTITKFPPLSKTKTDDTPNLKENCKDPIANVNLLKKTSNEQNIPSLKKVSNVIQKKKGEKKKPKLSDIKPEIIDKYKQYTDFLGLINLSNNLKVMTGQKCTNFTLYVGKGNNSSLIKTLFRNYRPWWTIQQSNPDNPNINLFWFQLRQNQILDSFKQNTKTDADFQNCQIYVEQPEQKQQIKEQIIQKQPIIDTKINQKTTSQIRSQSVTQKDMRVMKMNATKRSSSRAKGNSKQQVSPGHNFGKQIKDEIDNEVLNNKKRKTLVNPKMWPIYHNYRKFFSQIDMKYLKKLAVIHEDGKILAKISKNKIRTIQCRSSYLKIHNHLANNWNLSNKKALFMNLKNYYDAKKINPFQYIPMTFHINDMNDKEFEKFQEEYNRRTEQIKEEEKSKKNQQFKYSFKPKKRNAWLVKPGQNTNRGTGIEVVQSLQEIKEIIQKDKVDKLGRPRTHIVQEYIMPFLYQKRKFDIRSYIIVTSINGYQKGYWFQDGYIRTASKEFNMKNLNNKYIHLTNDAVQKYHQDYGKFEPGNKLSFSDFQRYLDTVYNSNSQNGGKLKFYQQAYPQMKKLAADAVRAVYTKMDPKKKEFSFEIFGLDFLIDQNFKVWLIEANTNPCLQLACPLLGRLIPNMLQNAFKLVIDPIFPPPPIQQLVTTTKKLILPQNQLQSNKFELIFDEVQEGKELKALLTNTPEVKIYDIEQEEDEYEENQGECKEKNIISETQGTAY